MVTHDVDEAVLLSDRIVMMTNGPAATIGEILRVDLPRPRNRVELAEDRALRAVPQGGDRLPVHAPGPCREGGGLMDAGACHEAPSSSAVEVWVPGTDRQHCWNTAAACTARPRASRVLSRKLCFGRGEGLPGQAWEQGGRSCCKQFEGSYFRRTAGGACRRPDLRHRAADLRRRLPERGAGDLLRRRRRPCRRHRAVAQRPGRVEGHDAGRRLLRRAPAEAFEFISRRTTLPPRHRPAGPGLGAAAAGVHGRPGQGLALPARRQRACKVGINRGFALPCASSRRPSTT